MATHYNDSGTFTANLAISAFRAVVISNNGGVTYSTGVAGALPDGISINDAQVGDPVQVVFLHVWGTTKCTTTGTVTVGDTLFWTALGQVGNTGAGTVTAGKAISTSVTGATIEFLPKTTNLN